MKKRILVVSQYYFPEQFRINDICQEWIKKGYEVTVLTGIPNYPDGDYFKGYGLFKNRREKKNGVDIIRIPLVPRKKNAIFLSLNYLSFMISGYLWATFTRKKFDQVFIYEVSPMTQAIPGIQYARRHKIDSTIYVMDLWPENFVEMSGIENKIIMNAITKMVKFIYANSKTILISSPGFEQKITELGDYQSKIKYWPQYAEDFYEPSVKKSEIVKLNKEKFNITFAGNVGYAQGLELLPIVAKKLMEQNIAVNFNIVGSGRYKDEMIKTISENKLNDYFLFFDQVEATEIPKILYSSDVALISMSESPLFSLTIPAKVQSILATGTPILVSADGILEKIVIESNAGLWSGAGDVDGMVKNIIELQTYNQNKLDKLRENALVYSNDKFNKEKLLKQIDNLWET